jgi:hypothetical protein
MVAALGTIAPVKDYAGAWTTERGRCHRLVYTEADGRPANCPGPPVRSGWRQDGEGRWFVVDACDQQLLARPHREAHLNSTRMTATMRVTKTATIKPVGT